MQSDPQTTPTKWKGMLVNALRKIQKEFHPLLTIEDDALEYLEELMVQLLRFLCAIQPHSVDEVKERVKKTFPPQLTDWAIRFAESATEKGKKKKLYYPVDKVQIFLQKEVLGFKVDYAVVLYISAILEYISSDILKLTGNYVKNIRDQSISANDLKVATKADKALVDMFHGDEAEPTFEPYREPLGKRGSLSYSDILRDFTMSEEQYIRELNLLTKVFRKPLIDSPHLFSEEEVDSVFCNLTDIYELTLQFWSMIEAATEMAGAGTKGVPLLGDYFEEMAEFAEFEAYESYAMALNSCPDGVNGTINSILAKPGVAEYLKGKELYEATKYILPKLLFGPVYHCLEYFEYMKLMMTSSPDGEDREKIDEALGALRSLQVSLERMATSETMRKRQEDRIFYQRRIGVNTHTTTAKMNEIQKSIDGWEGKDIRLCCSELLKEGHMVKPIQGGRKATERYVFLFDSLMICVKQNARHSLTGLAGSEYRFKEKFFLRKIEIKDIDDTEELKNAFAITCRDQPPYVLTCKSEAEKNDWMAVLLTLHMRSTLDRHLDAMLAEEAQSVPLCLPDPQDYCFAEEDTDDTIIFEDSQENESGAPIIKGGTLIKLVERLTYHTYADPAFIRIFLTTYRSFCKPQEFLDLLILRYEIPEPPLSMKDQMAAERGQPIVREDLRRFRKEYSQPIQLRVLNVLRQWLDQHYYDFERDPELLVKLQRFLESSPKSKAIKRSRDVITKIISRKAEFVTAREQYSFGSPPPPIEWHLTQDPEFFDIMQLHPLEIARQLTLIESELYRLIKPSELVGSAWMKSDKDKTSPNALRMIRFSNTLTYWYEKCIIDAQNFEERVAVLSRIVDILMALEELNNFNGILEVIAALNSAPVFRLHLTFAELTPKRQQALEENRELADSHHKKYVEKLRSINPPCVPFLGMYLTNILKSEDGNPDFLANHPNMINFNKRRKVAEITGEIQQYQNQPYNLEIECAIRSYLQTLDPTKGMTEKEINDYLYEKSLLIEPRNQKVAPKFPRKTDISLKSPGIKPSSGRSGGRKISIISSDSDMSKTSSPHTSRFRSGSQNSTLSVAESTISLANTALNSIEEDCALPPKVPPRAPRQSTIEDSSKSVPSLPPPSRLDEREDKDPVMPPPPLPRKPSRPTSLPISPPVPPRSPVWSNAESPALVFSPVGKRPPPPPPACGNPCELQEETGSVTSPPPLPPRPPKTPSASVSTPVFTPVSNFDLPLDDSSPPVIPPRPPKTPK